MLLKLFTFIIFIGLEIPVIPYTSRVGVNPVFYFKYACTAFETLALSTVLFGTIVEAFLFPIIADYENEC